MITLRPEQRKCVDEGLIILKRHNLLYLAAEVRTGKTLMSMTIAHEMRWKRICFITKKKAMSSVKADLKKSEYEFDTFTVINFESAAKLRPEYDLYIIDEAASCGAFPKPGVRTKSLKKLIGKRPIILMSGTPTAESYSQIFHQFWLSYYSPFSIYKNFYDWAKEYVTVKIKYIGGLPIKDYSKAKDEKVQEIIKHYMITLSQRRLGLRVLWMRRFFKLKLIPGFIS